MNTSVYIVQFKNYWTMCYIAVIQINIMASNKNKII